MAEDEEGRQSDPLQRHVAEQVQHGIVPIRDSCCDRDAVEFPAHHLSYKMQRPNRIRTNKDIDLPFSCWMSLSVELAEFEAAEERFYWGCRIAVRPREDDLNPQFVHDFYCLRTGMIRCIIP